MDNYILMGYILNLFHLSSLQIHYLQVEIVVFGFVKTNSTKSNIKITYNDIIPSGIYLIDKQFCKYFVGLSSNNKTDTLIDNQFVYIMLKRSISQKLYIDLFDSEISLTAFNLAKKLFTKNL
jgi:hypothetical protein